jgi:hypothetical protein
MPIQNAEDDIETGIADGRLSKTQKFSLHKDSDVVEALKTYK